jgi:ubiquitin-protein ligase E3 C
MFDQHELQEVVGGADNPIDVDDLERNSNMEAKEETIIMFWKVVRTFNQEQLRALLKFVTSTSNPPL